MGITGDASETQTLSEIYAKRGIVNAARKPSLPTCSCRESGTRSQRLSGDPPVAMKSLSRSITDWGFALGFVSLGLAPASGVETPEIPSFRNDVIPVLTKKGCNLGACHGAATGKADLALSLRGETPERDHATLVNSFLNEETPRDSYLLRKATRDGVEHQGGRRFTRDSESFRILVDWIAAGAPLDTAADSHLVSLEVSPRERICFAPEHAVQLTVTARFCDGSTRDVTRWAVYEPSTLNVSASEEGLIESHSPGETTISVRYLDRHAPVRLAFVPARADFTWSDPPAFNFIDEHLHRKWLKFRLNPSGLCDDNTFLRRASLDLTGRIPTEEEARRFAADSLPDKRARVVEELLETEAFADFWALKWADLLRVEEKVLDARGVKAFHGWIRQSMAENKPLDQFAREILVARGSTYEAAPSNYYRALRNPDARAEAIAQVFLGTRLNCAKCHNHPFEKWTMDDYYEFAAIFDGMDYEIIENKRRDKNDKNMFIGEQIVKLVEDRKLKDPRTDRSPTPRLLGVAQPMSGGSDRFEILAEWITSPKNPLFPRVQVNRTWFHLMGRGLVDPVDDFRATNPAIHPELLDALAVDFVASGFDLKHTIRTICASRAYQLEATPHPGNVEDTQNFTRQAPRRLDAEALLDSTFLALGGRLEFGGYQEEASISRAIQVRGVQASYRGSDDTSADRFLKLFGKPPRLTDSDTERTNDTSLAQIFELTSGATLNDLLTSPENRISQWLDLDLSDGALVDSLSWSILSRAPTDEETQALSAYLARARARSEADLRRAMEDIAWSLLNAKEFLLRK